MGKQPDKTAFCKILNRTYAGGPEKIHTFVKTGICRRQETRQAPAGTRQAHRTSPDYPLKNDDMEKATLTIGYTRLGADELAADDRALVEQAKAACATSYVPYSHFRVGAAARLSTGETVCGSNQENAAYPSGTCAERCTIFYANAHRPDAAVETLAIAARRADGRFTPEPITPCGACRQVLIETERRYGRPMRIVLYGERETLVLESASDLLPFRFDADAM